MTANSANSRVSTHRHTSSHPAALPTARIGLLTHIAAHTLPTCHLPDTSHTLAFTTPNIYRKRIDTKDSR